MKKMCWLGVMLITWEVCNGQNLVSNPSFEIYDSCPDQNSQISKALGWASVNGSADYFHLCSTNSWSSIPDNVPGYQLPHSLFDSAYSGIITILSNLTHEIMGISLTDALTIGQTYYVSFIISAGYAQNGAVHFACFSNKIGVKFSTHSFISNVNQQLIDNTAHIYSNSIIADTVNWVKIKGSFVADSAYTYLVLGNFFSDSTNHICSDTIQNLGAYYYIDEVCVSTDSTDCNISVGIIDVRRDKDLILFPNPFGDEIKITVNGIGHFEASLFDITSRKIFNQSFTSSIIINTRPLTKGIYLYEVRNNNGVITNGKVVKE